jgi:hypothetical protein
MTNVPIIRMPLGRMRWTVLEHWRAALQNAHAVPWLDPSDLAGALCLKQNPLRTVWRVPLAEGTVVAKVFHAPHSWNRLKQAVIGPPARMEFEAARYGARHDLPVLRPIAWGLSLDGQSVLLTEEVPDSNTLDQAWLRSPSIELIEAISGLLAKLHLGRFTPADLHPENVLINRDLVATLIDLHGSRYGQHTSTALAQGNFVDLHQWFRRHASRTACYRCLDRYLTIRHPKSGAWLRRAWTASIAHHSGVRAEALARKRDRAIFGDGPRIGRVQVDGWSGWAFLSARRPWRESVASHHVFDQQEWQATLVALITSGSSPRSITVGEHTVDVRIERGSPAPLRQSWESAYRRLHRHDTVGLPLALMISENDEAILLSEQGRPLTPTADAV